MEPRDMIFKLRTEKGLSQEELAERLFVTRQAVSRWENGETVPNTETLKLLSKVFCVSINTLLGSPRELICACCGMPLEDGSLSKEPDGFFNEDYCKWCYADGEYTLDVWKTYGETDGKEKLKEIKAQLLCECNGLLRMAGFPMAEDLHVLPGAFVNMEYPLPGGQKAKFLDDAASYLGNQLEGPDGRCVGVAANMDAILICTYGENGKDPELVLYKKR